MPIVANEARLVWYAGGKRFWLRQYWLGNILSVIPYSQRLLEFYSGLQLGGGWYDKLVSSFSVGVEVTMYEVRQIAPEPLWKLDLTRFHGGDHGSFVTGTQAWHATCRVNWFSTSTIYRPHWTQISPVPQFNTFLAPTAAEYVQRIREYAEAFEVGFTSSSGDIWRGAIRRSSGHFNQVIGSDVLLFKGRQKTRRRIF
jgi:hypothetical protein